MKTIRLTFRQLFTLAIGSLLITTTSCKKEDNSASAQKTIAEIVNTDANFSLLKQAVDRAGLGAALSAGSLTVFAPDNAAFAASGITSTDINDATPEELIEMLTYHVIGTKIASSGVPASDTVNSLEGTNLYVSKNTNGVFVNGIKVKTADVSASNGVVHVISEVIESVPSESIAEEVAADPNFSTLLAAVVKADLVSVFSNKGKYTVFAPTNAAFDAAGLTSVINDPNTPASAVVAILKAHVIGTNVFASDLIQGSTAPTLQTGVSLTIGTTPPSVKITGSSNMASLITDANIVTTNGVIHVIDKVLQ